LEHVDDVAVHFSDGTIVYEQIKSALRQNPLTDWSVDLWKTIANWLDAIDGGNIDVSTSQFQLYVTPPHQGNWSRALSEAKVPDEVHSIAAEIETKFKKLKKPKACDLQIKRFLDASDEQRVALVTRFNIVSVHDDPVAPLRDLIKTAVAPEMVDPLCHSAIGMAKEQADRLIRDGKTALIDADIFKMNFRTFVQKTNIPGLLTSLAPMPAHGEVAALLSSRPIFVRQLEIIDAADEERVRAVSDFLRTSADKSAWAEQGLIFEGSLVEWDDNLIARYGLIRGEVSDLHSACDTSTQGRLVYRRCAQVQAPLEGRVVPGHFVTGCFNSLADSMRLGWHPNYQSLLSDDE
jgi:hypothetical protein